MHGQLLTVLVPEARYPINPTLSDHRELSVGSPVDPPCVSKTRYKHYIPSSLQRLLSRESKKCEICSPGRAINIVYRR